MEQGKHSFGRTVWALAVPAALQSLLQSSFSMVDQLMIGQLGSVWVAGVGLAGKFSSVFSVLASAVGAVAGIMISQYLGQGDKREVRRSFFLNLQIVMGLALVFGSLCAVFPRQLMGLYTRDRETMLAAAGYLFVLGGSFLPAAGATLLAVLFRCVEKAALPLYAGIAAAVLNTGLNYILIFGKLGFPALGAEGAAAATVLSQLANVLILLCLFRKHRKILAPCPGGGEAGSKFNWGQYSAMLLPVLVCELMWSLGENVYAGIYGRLGTESCAAMTLTNPVQGLLIGALCGLSQAAGVIVGKKLGTGEYEEAYAGAKKLIRYGLFGSLVLSAAVVLSARYYVEFYPVEETVRNLAVRILYAYAAVAPCKVLNMILSGGVLRSGGKTSYVMAIDLVGTWGFGVPLGLLAAFVFRLEIPCVYFILSMEEFVRFGISAVVFRKRRWMRKLEK